jgi:molecular chaperone DnaJ
MNKDFYNILGVTRNASDSEIKKAYRKLAMKYHPDKHQGDKVSEEKFKEVTEAYETLKDPKKKVIFDTYGNTSNPFGGGNPFHRRTSSPGGSSPFGNVHFSFGSGFEDISSIFNNDAFHNIFTQESKKRVTRDIKQDLFLTLMEFDTGVQTEVEYIKQVLCSSCRGVLPQQQNCVVCSGTGLVSTTAKQTVQVTPGLHAGIEYRFKQRGDYVPGQTVGDLVVILREHAHPVFKRYNAFDLLSNTTISFPDAAIGTAIEFANLHDRRLNIKIPAGVQHGTQLTLRGQGMLKPSAHGAQDRGSIILTIFVETPKELSEEEKELYLKLKDIAYNKIPITSATGRGYGL